MYRVIQTTDYLWHIVAPHGTGQQIADASLKLWRSGLDRAYSTRAEAEAAMRELELS
jgi:hypothetical protein